MRPSPSLTRRAVLAALGAGALVGLGYALRGIFGAPPLPAGLADDGPMMGGGMMGVSGEDMNRYMEMFNRHNEITRTSSTPSVPMPPKSADSSATACPR